MEHIEVSNWAPGNAPSSKPSPFCSSSRAAKKRGCGRCAMGDATNLARRESRAILSYCTFVQSYMSSCAYARSVMKRCASSVSARVVDSRAGP